MFDIKFGKKDKIGILSTITINDFQEDFYLHTYENSIENYKKKWVKNLKELLGGELNCTVLMTSNKMGWVIYKNDNSLSITQQLFIEEIVGEKVDLYNADKYIKKYEKNRPLNQSELDEYKKEGVIFETTPMLFSEWKVELKDIESFYKKLKK